MPAALQRKKDSSKYFNMSAVLFTLFLEGLTSFAICIHGLFRPFATTFVKYAGKKLSELVCIACIVTLMYIYTRNQKENKRKK